MIERPREQTISLTDGTEHRVTTHPTKRLLEGFAGGPSADRNQGGMRRRGVRGLHRNHGRPSGLDLHGPRLPGPREKCYNHRGPARAANFMLCSKPFTVMGGAHNAVSALPG